MGWLGGWDTHPQGLLSLAPAPGPQRRYGVASAHFLQSSCPDPLMCSPCFSYWPFFFPGLPCILSPLPNHTYHVDWETSWLLELSDYSYWSFHCYKVVWESKTLRKYLLSKYEIREPLTILHPHPNKHESVYPCHPRSMSLLTSQWM